jgi:hypothetical protein
MGFEQPVDIFNRIDKSLFHCGVEDREDDPRCQESSSLDLPFIGSTYRNSVDSPTDHEGKWGNDLENGCRWCR